MTTVDPSPKGPSRV